MSPSDRKNIRYTAITTVISALITALIFCFVSNAFGMFRKNSDYRTRVEKLELTTMNKEETMELINQLTISVNTQNTSLNQFMVNTDANTKRIFQEIDIIQKDIKSILPSIRTIQYQTAGPKPPESGGYVNER